MLAIVSQDAVFGAVITVGLLVCGGVIALVKRSWTNGEALSRVEKSISECDIAKMRTQVDELWMDRRETWKWLKERGDMEALNLGLAKRNSPLAIAGLPQEPLIERLYTPYLDRLLEIYRSLDGVTDESILFEAVAKRLGDEMTRDVCPALKTDKGGCVSLALAFLKKRMPLP